MCANNTRCVHTLAAREPVLSAKTSPRVFQEYVLVNLTSVTLRGSPCNFPDETAILFLLVSRLYPRKQILRLRVIFFQRYFFKKITQILWSLFIFLFLFENHLFLFRTSRGTKADEINIHTELYFFLSMIWFFF